MGALFVVGGAACPAETRWIASVDEIPGVHVYGPTREATLGRAQSLSLEILADEIAHGER